MSKVKINAFRISAKFVEHTAVENKKKIRAEIQQDIEAYLAKGGKIETVGIRPWNGLSLYNNRQTSGYVPVPEVNKI